MKCPKCGFNSFEYYDTCKKCSTDLIGYKQKYSITALVLPLEAKERLAAESQSVENMTDQNVESTEIHDDIFSFDLPEDTLSSTTQNNEDPFNFDAQLPDVTQMSSAQSEDDVFADLLESTSQVEDSPFAAPSISTSTAAVASAASSTGSGDFDLESFAWDDTATVSAAPANTDVEAADDFDSLFGDIKETAPK